MVQPFPSPSLRLNPCELDDLGPFLDFVSDELAEIGWRARQWHSAQVRKPCLDLGMSKTCIDLGIQLVDDSRRRVLGRTNPTLIARFIPGQKVRQRWDVGK